MTICPSDAARPRIKVWLDHASLRSATRLPLAALMVQDVATRGEIFRFRVTPGPQALIQTASGPYPTLPAASGLRLPLVRETVTLMPLTSHELADGKFVGWLLVVVGEVVLCGKLLLGDGRERT